MKGKVLEVCRDDAQTTQASDEASDGFSMPVDKSPTCSATADSTANRYIAFFLNPSGASKTMPDHAGGFRSNNVKEIRPPNE